MAFDGIVVSNITSELNRALTGGRISKIAQPEADEILLTIKNQKDTYRLRLSASASLPLIYLTERNVISPLTAPNFCMLLRKHISGARILSVTQPGLERVICIALEHLDELGDLCRKLLYMEIMGKHSNLIFCKEDGTIIDSIKHVSQAVSSVREVLPGRPYFIPNTQNKQDPFSAGKDLLLSILSGKESFPNALMKHFTGISRTTALELGFRAGLDCDLPGEYLTEAERLRGAEEFEKLIGIIRSSAFTPCIAWKQDEPQEFASICLTGYTDCRVENYDSISRVLEEYYAARELVSRMHQKSASLRKLVSNAIERSAKKYDLQLNQLKDSEKKEKYRIYGEMLNTYGYSCPQGAKEFEVINYYNNEALTIPLDPTLSPSENAVRFFERYNKMKRTAQALEELTKETEAELNHLESVSASIDIAESDADLDEIRKELAACGYIRSTSKGRRDDRKKSTPYHYRSSDGFDIYVGRNNLQNDELTFRFAQGNDIWMHAKKAHGSHVIIKTEGKEVPDRTYEEAGALAAWYSQSRQAPKVEVDYIEKKHVKKPAGGKPGFVIYHTNYSLLAIPSVKDVIPVK